MISYVCSYDIADTKRLRRVHRCVSQLGVGLSYSVFYLQLSSGRAEELKRQLNQLLNHRGDQLYLVRCADYRKLCWVGCDQVQIIIR